MSEGWIKLHRKIEDSPLWKSSGNDYKIIMITLLLNANHKHNKWIWGGKEYQCGPGQFITSFEKLAELTKTTKNIVRKALDKLEKYNFSTHQGTPTGILVTIENWAFYQDEDLQGTHQGTQKEHTRNTRGTPNKNVRMKEYIDNINIISSTEADGSCPFQEIINSFNQICISLPKVKVASNNRKSKMKTRWSELKVLEKFTEIFQKIESSDFLTGRTTNKWKASFDWIIENDQNYIKVLEGNYSNKNSNTDWMV